MNINSNQIFPYMSKSRTPCLDCRMRDIGCHSACILYEDYKNDLKVSKHAIKTNLDSGKSIRSYSYYSWKDSYHNGRKVKRYYI